MIDLTPLDVRNKRGDFKKGMRGYDSQEVDVFLELVAERLEALVRENIQLRDRTRTLQEQVEAQTGREQAVQDALVTAQELRKDIREQSQREADHVMREAEAEARRLVAEAEAEVRSRLRAVERQMDHARDSIQELERRRTRFLQDFRTMLQRELDFVEVEEERTPLEERVIEMDLGTRRSSAGGAPEVVEAPEEAAASERAAEQGDAAAETGDAAAETEAQAGPEGEDADRPVDVADLEPEAAVDPQSDDGPSSLELELMAGQRTDGDGGDFPDVPDLETVLAEAGIDDPRPVAEHEISPPPAEEKPVDDDSRRPEDRLALFDKDDEKKKR